MEHGQDLGEQSALGGVSPKDAYLAMMTLGALYETGGEDIPLDWGLAFSCYEEAARLDGPEGYLALSRLCRQACIATEDAALKEEYATYARITCDPETIARFGWPEIALNVGVVCEHMAEFADKASSLQTTKEEYYGFAAQFFSLAAAMQDVNKPTAPALCTEALAKIQELGYGIDRPPPSLAGNTTAPRV